MGTADGRTDGEYRWLQPNGLYRVVRYYVTADSGFVAQVSEESGPDVPNYYTNSITGDNGDAVISFPEGRSINEEGRSLGTSSQLNSIRRRPNTITRQSFRKPIPSPTPAIVNTPRPAFVRQSSTRQQSSNTQQSFNNQQSFSSQGNFVGEIIDGGIIDGGTIDGGIINGAFINGEFVPSQSFGSRSK